MNEDEYLISSWFNMVYTSKYCKESKEFLQSLCYSDFLDLANMVSYYQEIEKAVQMDQQKEQERRNKHNL